MTDEVRLVRALRLRAQGLVPDRGRWGSAPEAARGMLAMQAQDRLGVLWALSLRSTRADTSGQPTEAEVVADLDERRIVRNRPSRGTLQVTAPEDLHWLTGLLSERSNAAGRRRRGDVGVTEAMERRVGDVLRSELADGRMRTRPELVEACRQAGVPLDGPQAGHLLRHHTERMTIVFARRRGRTDTFALADDWIDQRRVLEREEALAEVAIRYFRARGPATPQCLGWWADLAMRDVRAAIAAAGPALAEVELAGTSMVIPSGTAGLSAAEVDASLAEPMLLPPFDEYLLGYRHRSPQITPERLDAVVPGRNGMFKPIIVVDGEVVGLWSRAANGRRVTVTLMPFGTPAPSTIDRLGDRARAYGDFLGLEARVEVEGRT
ncbi:MAG: AlkZ family DNA glycosylase [Microthrixaceae bacterium]|nr:AlkZ family DNA glycosylase [Microthrixaceae bacterium]